MKLTDIYDRTQNRRERDAIQEIWCLRFDNKRHNPTYRERLRQAIRFLRQRGY